MKNGPDKTVNQQGSFRPGALLETNGLVRLIVVGLYHVTQLNGNCVSQTSLSRVVPGWHGPQGTSFL